MKGKDDRRQVLLTLIGQMLVLGIEPFATLTNGMVPEPLLIRLNKLTA